MLKIGIQGTAQTTVTSEICAKAVGSGTLDVFATPALIALVEKAATLAVSAELDEGMTSVGTKLDFSHTAATPIGMKATATATLIEIDGRRLVFSVSASDEVGEIGNGTHERFLVNAEKFLAKTNAKKA